MTKIVAFFLLATSAASAADGAIGRVCKRYNFVQDQERCLADFRNAYYMDEAAGAVCERYNFVQDQHRCLTELVNLVFDTDSIQVCRRYNFVNDQVACLKRLGRPAPAPGNGGCRDLVIYQTQAAIAYIDNGNVTAAKQALYDLQSRVNTGACR